MDLTLRSPSGTAVIRTQGAQVVSAVLGGRDLLWLSPVSNLPLRGGVPICFPWFGKHPAGLPSHGFARLRTWEIESSEPDRAVFSLGEDPMWPHSFEASLTVTLGTDLRFDFAVTNTDTAPFSFTYALHTYFAVTDLSTWQLSGLSAPITATPPIDQVFADVPDRLEFDGLYVEATNMPSAVVWNPGPNSVPDIGDEWRRFVCVERGRIGSAEVTLAPGAEHSSTMRIGRL